MTIAFPIIHALAGGTAKVVIGPLRFVTFAGTRDRLRLYFDATPFLLIEQTTLVPAE